ncbi:MAG: hypothetical protein AB1801_15105 [Chloroflexota bacterium]
MTGERLDLVALVADADAEWTLRTLLEKRTAALQIRPLSFKILREIGHDPGVFLNAPFLLRPYVNQTNHALVMLDREGSGREHRFQAQEMETDLENRLQQNGWVDRQGTPRAAAIVLDPELEIWVWSRSPHVATVLSLSQDVLQHVLSGFSIAPNGKPEHPKEALLAALRRGKQPHSARIFQELAERVGLETQERAFIKLRQTLQTWYPKI